jgi:hypothetical protein
MKKTIVISCLVAFTCLPAVCQDTVKIDTTMLGKDAKMEDIKKLYRQEIQKVNSAVSNAIELGDDASRDNYYTHVFERLIFLREAAKKSRLSIHERLVGVRIYSSNIRKTLKANYETAFDSIMNNKNLKPAEQDARMLALREGLSKAWMESRIVKNREYRYIYYLADNRLIRAFPARNSRFSEIYYGELKDSTFLSFLRNQSLSFNEEFGAMSSEIVSGYLGPVRMSFNTAISRARETTVDTIGLIDKTPDEIRTLVEENQAKNLSNNTLAHVLAGGGLLNLKAQYPLVYFNPIWSPNFRFDNELVANLSGQFSAAGTSIPENESNLWGGAGLHNHAFIPINGFTKGADETFVAFGFFFQYNITHVFGSGTFYNQLGISEPFWMGDFKAGIFYKSIQVSYNYLNFSNKYLDGQFENRITLAYAPQF